MSHVFDNVSSYFEDRMSPQSKVEHFFNFIANLIKKKKKNSEKVKTLTIESDNLPTR